MGGTDAQVNRSLCILFGLCHSPEQVYEDFDCETAETSNSIISACRIAFSSHADETNPSGVHVEMRVNEIYATELQLSLTRINRYSLALYERDGAWEVSAFVGLADGNFGERGIYGRNFRSVYIEVPNERVAQFKQSLAENALSVVDEPEGPVIRTLENGEEVSVVCLDGASLRAKYLASNSAWSVSRHNCRGRTEIDDFADALFDLAVEFDPTLEPYRFTLPKGD
jgi:hypothetical protein